MKWLLTLLFVVKSSATQCNSDWCANTQMCNDQSTKGLGGTDHTGNITVQDATNGGLEQSTTHPHFFTGTFAQVEAFCNSYGCLRFSSVNGDDFGGPGANVDGACCDGLFASLAGKIWYTMYFVNCPSWYDRDPGSIVLYYTKGASCDPDPCQNGAICTNNNGGYECECVQGYSGTNCENTDNCNPNPCQNGAICTNNNGGYECECVQGYSGTNCETNIMCNPDPCHNGALCTNNNGDYECECIVGYSGKNCDTIIDMCNPNPCQHGNCTHNSFDYMCNCTTGYIGKDCDSPCQCQNGATCVGNVCECTLAYEGPLCELNRLENTVFIIEQTLMFNTTQDEGQLRRGIADLFQVSIDAVTIKNITGITRRRLSVGVTYEIRTQDAQTLEKVNDKMKQTTVLVNFFQSLDMVLISASEPNIREACDNQCSGGRNLDCTCTGSPVGFIVFIYIISVGWIIINHYNYI